MNVRTKEKHLQTEEMLKMSCHSKQQNTVKCAQCSLTISSKYNLRRHMKAVHLKVRDMKCPHCEYSASQLGTLKNHIMCIHPKVSEVSGHKCFRCPLTFPSIWKLRLHIKGVHDKVKDKKGSSPFSCNGQIQKHVGNTHIKIQDKVSKETVHKRVQANEKQTDVSQTPVHKCPHCSKAFTRTSNLSVHMKAIHLKVQDLKCSHCHFTASQSQSIKSHIKNIHQKERGIRCPHCNYTASREVYVEKHIKRVHSEKITERLLIPAVISLGVNNQGKAMYCKPGTTQARSQSGIVTTIKCLYCSDTFTQQTNLRVHVEKMHSEQHYNPPPICHN
jgi:DNA-directed RNA polymerase subunit RPC12/RpoP